MVVNSRKTELKMSYSLNEILKENNITNYKSITIYEKKELLLTLIQKYKAIVSICKRKMDEAYTVEDMDLMYQSNLKINVLHHEERVVFRKIYGNVRGNVRTENDIYCDSQPLSSFGTKSGTKRYQLSGITL